MPDIHTLVHPTAKASPAEGFAAGTAVDTRAVESGNWSDPAIWSEGVPTTGQNAQIDRGVGVTVDTKTARVQTLIVDGKLGFQRDQFTHLQAETIVTRRGSTLEIGTADDPVKPNVAAWVTFVHHEDIAQKETDPERISKGLIAMGDVEIHGAKKTGWEEIATAPKWGDDTLELASVPTNWQVGDRLVVAPVEDPDGEEIRHVTAIDGTTVSLDSALNHTHVPPECDLPVHVANLTRNVQFRSESTVVPHRGHVMIATENGATVENAGFYDLGRTDKSEPITNSQAQESLSHNPSTRHPLHFHERQGETGTETETETEAETDRSDPEPFHVVRGCVVDTSPGWGIVNHHSSATITDCVSYDVRGAGFVAACGDEQGSFKRNIAIKGEGSGDPFHARANEMNESSTQQQIDDFGHAGHGFWLHSPGLDVENNVAAGHADYAYVYWGLALDDDGVDQHTDEQPKIASMSAGPEYPKKYGRPAQNGHGNGVEGESDIETIRSFTGNTAYAVGSGVGLRWIQSPAHSGETQHTDYENYNKIERFTVYGIHRDGKDPFTGANGISVSRSTHCWITDCRLIGTEDGCGINCGNDRWHVKNIAVHNSVITNFAVGITLSPDPYNIVAGCTLKHNRTNVSSLADSSHNSSILWLHNNTSLDADNDLFQNIDGQPASPASFSDIQEGIRDVK